MLFHFLRSFTFSLLFNFYSLEHISDFNDDDDVEENNKKHSTERRVNERRTFVSLEEDRKGI